MTTFHFVFVFLGISFLENDTKNHVDEKTLLEKYEKSCTEIERLKGELSQAVIEESKAKQSEIRNDLSYARKEWQRLLKKMKMIKT